MCVIMVLPKGVVLPFDKLQNAVWNNPHGYGLVMKDNGLLEVRKAFDPKGTDPDVIARLLEDNKDIERVIHLRWKTEGSLNLENTQPFTVYYSEGSKIIHREFMHNGTLYDYRETPQTVWQNGARVAVDDDSNTPSDSRNFADRVLRPMLLHFEGENGKADIQNPFLYKMIDKFWGVAQHNRGIIIANDQDHLLINQKAWSEINTTTGKFVASNDDYFSELKRGYEFEARKKRIEEQERQTRLAVAAVGRQDNVIDWPLTKLKEVPLGYKKDLSKSLEGLFEEMELWNEDDGIASLSALDEDEVKNFCYASPDLAAALIMTLALTLKGYYDEKIKITEDKDKATRHIASLKLKLSEAENQNGVINDGVSKVRVG